MAKLLKFAEKSDPVLRKVLPRIKDFADPDLQAAIEDMCYSILPAQLKAADAAHDSAAGMAANQWGLSYRVFVYTPDGSDQVDKTEVMLNPSYLPYLRPNEKQPEMVSAWEGCFSVPLALGIVNRYDAILATYFTPKGKKVQKIMTGWEARVFQHETDHVDGKLYDGCLDNFAGPECLERVCFKNKIEMDGFKGDVVKPSREEMKSRDKGD